MSIFGHPLGCVSFGYYGLWLPVIAKSLRHVCLFSWKYSLGTVAITQPFTIVGG